LRGGDTDLKIVIDLRATGSASDDIRAAADDRFSILLKRERHRTLEFDKCAYTAYTQY